MRMVTHCAILLALPAILAAQGPPSLAAQGPAATYEKRYAEFMALEPRADRMAIVHDLVLTRDAGRFTLESGSMHLLTSIGGRTVGAVFNGRGSFTFTPPTPIEENRLSRMTGDKKLESRFTELVLIFADSTAEELEHRLKFGPGEVGPARGAVRDALRYGSELHDKGSYFDADVMDVVLNGDASDMFYAHISRGGDRWVFTVNPWIAEGVQLSRRAKGTYQVEMTEVVSQFPRQGEQPAPGIERTRQAEVKHYVIETSLPRTGAGNVNFSAVARLDVTSQTPIGPWVAFQLYDELEVDSARWAPGEPVTAFKGEESPLLWLHMGKPLAAGEVRTVELFYHGDLIDRYGEWFFINSSAAWYPRTLTGRGAATFNLTYHTPESYLFASAGELVDSSAANGTVTTRWVGTRPMRNVSFNLGRFENYLIESPGVPPVTLLQSEAAHRAFGASAGNASRMSKQVGEDIATSMKFFQHVYGEAPVKRFYATEIPYAHGEAFPGLVHLSASTFIASDLQGFDEFFRAHEVAHQWWGIGVDFATYHDQWLSEGFSSFSGLWYLQTARKDNEKYFGMLDRWRADILVRGAEPGPIWLGHRAATVNDYRDYNIVVYQKGAWVVHMLRVLMLDMKTMSETRFTKMMGDFYTSYRGRRASTADFRRVVEKHVGTDMKWFFDQWIYGSAIPKYRVARRTEEVDGGKYRVQLRVEQQNVPDDFRMYVPITVDLGGGQAVRVRTQVKGPLTEIELPLLPSAPKDIRFNDLNGVLAQVDDFKVDGWSN